MQALICIPFAIASQLKTTKTPSLTTSFELRAERYQLPLRFGEFTTVFETDIVAKSDLAVFLTRPGEFETKFERLGTLEPRQNNVEIWTEFGVLSTANDIVPYFVEQPVAAGVEWNFYWAANNISSFYTNLAVTLNKISVRSLYASFLVETQLDCNRITPRNNAATPTTEFGIIVTRKQL